MPHSTLEERREYMRNWRAGIRRTKAYEDGSYIDEPLTQEMREYDRSVRNRIRTRAQEKRDRQARYAELQAHYKQRIAELCTKPFSWQESR